MSVLCGQSQRRNAVGGKGRTATKSPSMARFIASRPIIKISASTASHEIVPSHGEDLDVLNAPWCSEPPATPAATADWERCSVKDVNFAYAASPFFSSPLAPSLTFCRFPVFSASSSPSSSSALGATRSESPGSFPALCCANSRTDAALMFSRFAACKFPRSFVRSTIFIPGTARS